MELKRFILHEHKEFVLGCACVLNEEWPRSQTARMHMLEKSNIDLPYNIALVECKSEAVCVHNVKKTSSGGECLCQVVGHSRLCSVHGHRDACFIESVVISRNRRGKGYGRVLMEATEREAKSLGYKVAYLTTRDQQKFYQHLGYDFCEPIVALGSASKLLSDEHFQCLFGRSKPKPTKNAACPGKKNEQCSIQNTQCLQNIQNTQASISEQGSGAPPASAPPPPPLPPGASPCVTINGPRTAEQFALQNQGQVYWMKKNL